MLLLLGDERGMVQLRTCGVGFMFYGAPPLRTSLLLLITQPWLLTLIVNLHFVFFYIFKCLLPRIA